MDVLTDAVRSLRLIEFKPGVSQRRPPWGTFYPANTWDVVFYAIKGAPCWLTMDALDKPIALADNSICVLPHGHSHALRDSLDTEPVPVRRFRPPGYYGLMSYGGSDGAVTQVYFGGFKLDTIGRNSLWHSLPPAITIAYDETPSWLDPIFTWFREELTDAKLGFYSVASRLGELLIIQTIRMYAATSESNLGVIGALKDTQLLKVLNLMHANLDKQWTLQSLASAAGISRSRLAERFSAQMGEGPLHYLAQWRMQKAAMLLRDTNLSIDEIVEAVGYHSGPSFNAAFKRNFGLPPGRFRRGASLKIEMEGHSENSSGRADTVTHSTKDEDATPSKLSN